MKNIYSLLLLVLASTVQAASFDSTLRPVELKPQQEQAEAAHLSAEVLSRYHYRPTRIDDAISKKVFDSYLKSLDGEKVFFTQSDIDQFSNMRTSLDDAILNEDLTVPFAMFNRYRQRIVDRITFAQSLLKQGFDFQKNESYQFERENSPWIKSEEEMQDLWRKRVKNDWLRLKLAGKADNTIVETLNKRYEQYLSGASKLKSEDVFQSFMNAFTMSVDPHTNYFGIRASEDFDISMKLSLVGIGAVLQDKDEYTTIRELLAGGPAELSGALKIGDRIVGVGQGVNSPVVDVQGWRLDDTVALIRGETDSVVVLEILPVEAGPDGKHKFVSLIRKKISLDKQAAKKSIIEVKDGNVTHHIGVITLPEFYEDFSARQNGDKEFKSASRDVAQLLQDLKKDNVDSILIDLRNNGGGSLDEAVNLTGLFIDKGAVLQERDSKGNIRVDADTRAGTVWNGPMGVLINRASASASEIFAAAIQDYGRGVVIGESSFGKGTVQTVVNLDELAKNDTPKFGEVKMTVAQFFRINGGTTQLRGVVPDINLPAVIDPDNYGESSFDNALPWTQIKPADYKPVANLTSIFPKLVANHDARVSKDKEFQKFVQEIKDLDTERKKTSISLNLAERQKERDVKLARQELLEGKTASDKGGQVKSNHGNGSAENSTFEDDGLQANERNIDADIAIEKARASFKDVLLNETAHILSDEVELLKVNTSAAVK